jgi:hypothetical protein
VCQAAAQQSTRKERGTKPEDVHSSNSPDSSLLGTASGKLERLDNTLRPTDRLSRTMTLEEASKWLKNFDSYLTWNKPVIDKKSLTHLRSLLESFLDASMVSKLQTDESITEDTLVRGTGGLLETLKNYFVDKYHLINCRYAFSTCKQARGELFRTWWETKLRNAKECDLEMMASKD